MKSLLAEVVGHRGAAADAPENTLPAFVRAAEQGAAMVEFDAKLTADGAVILMHDDTLERTTSGRGAVATTPLAAIQALDAGAWFGPAWRGTKVPTLEQAVHGFAEARGLKMGDVVNPVRVATTGQGVGPGLYDCLAIPGRDACRARISQTLEMLRSEGPH